MNFLDSYTLSLMNSIQHPLLTDIMLIVSHLVSYSVLFLVFLLLIWRNKKQLSLKMLIGLLIEGITTLGLKSLIGRPRPMGPIQEIGYSFPSGHTSRTTFLAFLFSNEYGKKYIWVFITGLVIFSRLYLKVHYLTDVLGGLLVGGIAYYLVERFELGEKAYKKIKSKIKGR